MASDSARDLGSPWIDIEASGARLPPRNEAAPVHSPDLVIQSAQSSRSRNEAAPAPVHSPTDTGFLSSLALNIVSSMVICSQGELHQMQHRATLQSLTRRIKCAICLFALMWPVAAFLFGRGAAVFFGSWEASCLNGWWTAWLVGFLMLQLASIVMVWVAPLLLMWTLGAAWLLEVPHHCPMIRDFLRQVLALQGVQCAFFLSAAWVCFSARPALHRLRQAVGRTDPQLLEMIVVVGADEIPNDEECAVCLSHEAEGTDGSSSAWRQLACGHRFHEVCLLRWLEEARRCPICRSDLHTAYFGGGSEVELSAAG